MDALIDEMVRSAQRCERAQAAFTTEPLKGTIARLYAAIRETHSAWSGSFIGYHSLMYIEGLAAKAPGEFWDGEWGAMEAFSTQTCGRWVEYDYGTIENAILRIANVPDLSAIKEASSLVTEAFRESKAELLPLLDALLAVGDDPVIRAQRDKVADLEEAVPARKLGQAHFPKNTFTRDSTALQQGLRLPHHLQLECWIMQEQSRGRQAGELAAAVRHVQRYARHRLQLKGNTVAKTEGKIFIGHGHAQVWRDLKDFIQDRLRLPWDEFNREPVAGLSNKERLEQMMDEACFAFLVLTAEDEHADGTYHPRENVVHEAGLFQGRFGFRRAIILLEEGCEEFSNVHGIGQIRFPKGNISAKFEEIRRVLEREGLL